ncbi:MAG: hypothetical protein EOO77_33580 [Oxalobacteraceae bacterium]|jgi:hypothetical protein|nr:MAG: hypothetical protein EOO77_33580 [Oxalobacteraceae bacterium]
MAANSTLVKGATFTEFGIDSSPDGVGDADDVQGGTVGADAYYFDNTRGGSSVGDKVFTDFGLNDSLLATAEIFDGNNDGYIVLGGNARLDVERSSARNGGTAQFNMIDESGASIYAMRELGSKGGEGVNGAYVYADAATRVDLYNALNGTNDLTPDQSSDGFTYAGTRANVVEGTVGDNTLTGTSGADYFLFDTALGLNLGRDTITNFGAGDVIVTTSEIWNQNGNGAITYGANRVLDMPGSEGGVSTDPSQNPGGQIVFGNNMSPTPSSLTILGQQEIDGHNYFFYGFPTASA